MGDPTGFSFSANGTPTSTSSDIDKLADTSIYGGGGMGTLTFILILLACLLIQLGCGLMILFTFVVWAIVLITWRFQNLLRKIFVPIVGCRLICLGSVVWMGTVRFQYGPNPDRNGIGLELEDCHALSLVFSYAMLADFAWLTVVNFNFWWDLGRRQIRNPKQARQDGKWRYLKYSVFGWGSPILVLGVVAILDKIFGLNEWVIGQLLVDVEAPPGYRHTCKSRDGEVLLNTLPACTVFMLVILTFALVILRSIRGQQRDVEIAKERRSQSSISNFQIFWKLSILMGIGWMLENSLQIFLGLIEWATVKGRLSPTVGSLLYLCGGFIVMGLACVSVTALLHFFFWRRRETVSHQIRQVRENCFDFVLRRRHIT